MYNPSPFENQIANDIPSYVYFVCFYDVKDGYDKIMLYFGVLIKIYNRVYTHVSSLQRGIVAVLQNAMLCEYRQKWKWCVTGHNKTDAGTPKNPRPP